MYHITANDFINLNTDSLQFNGVSGTIGQYLSIDITGPTWVNGTSATTPSLAQVMTVGNTAGTTLDMNNNDIINVNGISGNNIYLTTNSLYVNGSSGTTGQVLSIGESGPTWIDNTGLIYIPTSNVGGGFNGVFEQLLLNPVNVYYNTAFGDYSLSGITLGNYNTSFGFNCLTYLSKGYRNTSVGGLSLQDITNGNDNTCIGDNSCFKLINGDENTCIGQGTLGSLLSGNDNIAIGYESGIGITSGDNNMYIGNSGIQGDNNTMRIGNSTDHYTGYIICRDSIDLSSNAINISSPLTPLYTAPPISSQIGYRYLAKTIASITALPTIPQNVSTTTNFDINPGTWIAELSTDVSNDVGYCMIGISSTSDTFDVLRTGSVNSSTSGAQNGFLKMTSVIQQTTTVTWYIVGYRGTAGAMGTNSIDVYLTRIA
jgi:hypothetical protein